MKYLLIQLGILFLSVILLYFFSTLPDFLPTANGENLDWYKVVVVFSVLFLLLQSVISLIIYLVQKFLAYGRKEFPPPTTSMKWGIGLSLSLLLIVILHIFHFLSFGWGVVILVIVAVLLLLL